jgi:SAM-dependent methyltransferase
MVDEYNKWAQKSGYGAERMEAWQYDLVATGTAIDDSLEEKLRDFDVAIISMALHHVADPGRLLSRLRGCLRSGGVCVVLDNAATSLVQPVGASDGQQSAEPEDLENHPQSTVKNKKGFTREEIYKLYQDAGLGKNFDHVVIERPFEMMVMGKKLQVTGFLSRGEKA